MGKGKPRHNPYKLANMINPHCPCYEVINGKSYCTSNGPTNPKCGGNVHNCVKVLYQQLAIKKHE